MSAITKKEIDEGLIPPPIPKRPLTAYNLFGIMERHYILQQHQKPPSSPLPDAQHDPHYATRPLRYRSVALPENWYIVGNNRKPRQYHKNHGLISFKSLSKQIAAAWAEAPESTKEYCKGISKSELARYREEQRKYKEEWGEEAYESQTRKRKNQEKKDARKEKEKRCKQQRDEVEGFDGRGEMGSAAGFMGAASTSFYTPGMSLEDMMQARGIIQKDGAVAAAAHSSDGKATTSSTSTDEEARLAESRNSMEQVAMLRAREQQILAYLAQEKERMVALMAMQDAASSAVTGVNSAVASPTREGLREAMLGAVAPDTNTQAMVSDQDDSIRAILETRNDLRALQAAQEERRRLLLAMQQDGSDELELAPERGRSGKNGVMSSSLASARDAPQANDARLPSIQAIQEDISARREHIQTAQKTNSGSTRDPRFEELLADPLRSTMASDVARNGLLSASSSTASAVKDTSAAAKDITPQAKDARLQSILATQEDINARRERIQAMLSANTPVLPAVSNQTTAVSQEDRRAASILATQDEVNARRERITAMLSANTPVLPAVSNQTTAAAVSQEDWKNAAAALSSSGNNVLAMDDDLELLLAARHQKEQRLRAIMALDDERFAQALASRGYGLQSLEVPGMSMMFPHPLMNQMALQQHYSGLYLMGPILPGSLRLPIGASGVQVAAATSDSDPEEAKESLN